MEECVEFFSEDKKIIGNLHLPEESSLSPCVVLCHGLVSSKDSEKWTAFAHRFYEKGYASLRFNFRGCGWGKKFSKGEFKDSTLNGRIKDYIAALDFLERTNKVDMERIGVVGSSFGGCVAIAAEEERPKAYIVMATPYSISPTDEMLKEFKEKGFYEDFKRYDIGEAISKLKKPILIIHGSGDAISVEDARKLYEKAKEPKKLEIIEGGSHIFVDNIEHFQKVLRLSVEWFKKYL